MAQEAAKAKESPIVNKRINTWCKTCHMNHLFRYFGVWEGKAKGMTVDNPLLKRK